MLDRPLAIAASVVIGDFCGTKGLQKVFANVVAVEYEASVVSKLAVWKSGKVLASGNNNRLSVIMYSAGLAWRLGDKSLRVFGVCDFWRLAETGELQLLRQRESSKKSSFLGLCHLGFVGCV